MKKKGKKNSISKLVNTLRMKMAANILYNTPMYFTIHTFLKPLFFGDFFFSLSFDFRHVAGK